MNKVFNGRPVIEWGVVSQPQTGYTESGDRYLGEPFPNGVLTVVIDGLGHGDKAAAVAKTTVATLKDQALHSLNLLFEECHKKLRGTRGVVMSLASFNGPNNTMTWVGVGNVKGFLLRANAAAGPPREGLLLRGGIIGYRMPSLRPVTIPVTGGDTLIFATDGLRSSFAEKLTVGDPPQQIADDIFARYHRGTDDALVLAARYNGGGVSNRLTPY